MSDKNTQNTQSVLLPLTDAQRDIVFDQLHYRNSAIYNIGGRICLSNIDVERLIRAHQQLICDHPAFRLRLVFDGTDICQTLSAQADKTLVRLSFADALAPEHAAKTWLKAEFAKPFDLKADCLFRAFLLDLGDDNYWYVGMGHHLLNDGWGFSNWVGHLAQLYNGQQPECFDDQDWIDVVEAHKQYRQSERFGKDKAFWTSYCQDSPEPFLPANYAALYPTSEPLSQREVLKLSPQQYSAMFGGNEYLQKNLQSLFIAAIAVYFSKAYGLTSLTLGVPSHNRKGARQKAMVGLFSAINLINIDLDDNLSAADLLTQVLAEQRKVFRHKQFPIGEIARHLQRKTIPELYEVGFNYLRLDGDMIYGEHHADYFYDPNDHQSLPINFGLWEAGDHNIALQIDYNNSYFEQREVVLIKKRILFLLSQMAQTPDMPLSQLEIVTAEEQTMQQFYNCTKQNFNLTKTFHEMFEELAALMPDRVALRGEGYNISYGQLNQQSQQVAAALHRQGVKQGDLVGICLKRSAKLLQSLLAVQKLGAAFLPLDPAYPAARLNYMLEHSGAKTLVCEQGLQERFDSNKVKYIDFDQLERRSGPLPCEAKGEHQGQLPAYVLYTSGSTGKPKGVTVSNRALSNFLQSMAQQPGMGINDTLLAVTPFSFDIALLELFLPLSTGACVYLFEHAVSENLDKLKNLLERCEVNYLQMTPSAWKLLLATGWQGNPEMTALAGGESLSTQLAQQLSLKVNKLWNMYGPTETTIWSSCAQVDFGQYFNNIGKPIANTGVHILDKALNPVPMAVAGDLYLSGSGLAEGYLNNREATDAAFIQWRGIPLYKTGDRARLTVSGELEYLGRGDTQVKINGHRIEPSEIQSHLNAHPEINDSVVKAIQLADGRKVLCAYYTGVRAPQKTELVTLLSQSLPKFMVPGYFIHLDKMPLTPSGKTDVKNLPLPDADCAPKLDSKVLEGLSETEVTIYQCVAKVLGSGHFSQHSNFFEAGANSDDMLLITNALNDKFGSNLSIIDVFTFPTVSKLGEYLQNNNNIPVANVQSVRTDKRKKGKALLNRKLQRKKQANEI